jgi:hypothetical protein
LRAVLVRGQRAKLLELGHGSLWVNVHGAPVCG